MDLMTSKIILTAVLLAIVLVEKELRPRIGFTREGKMLLWYGKKIRKFMVLF